MLFGQLVIGPPGSGKTTYCDGMCQFMESTGRKVAVINMDPANDTLPYKCSLNISELITVNDAMEQLKLGPNGGLIYCMEFLEKNVDWLMSKIAELKDCYLIIDCPGQVELYTHHNSVHNIVETLIKKDVRLTAVHLVDSHYCNDPSKFIAVLLTSLSTMLKLELPHVNVLSKVDLIEKFGKLDFNLDFYTEVMDLSYLLNKLNKDPFMAKHNKMNELLVGLIEDYSLVSFVALNIQEKESMLRVMKQVDKANGYVFGADEERNIQSLLSCAMGADFEYAKIGNIQEKYVNMSDSKLE